MLKKLSLLSLLFLFSFSAMADFQGRLSQIKLKDPQTGKISDHYVMVDLFHHNGRKMPLPEFINGEDLFYKFGSSTILDVQADKSVFHFNNKYTLRFTNIKSVVIDLGKRPTRRPHKIFSKVVLRYDEPVLKLIKKYDTFKEEYVYYDNEFLSLPKFLNPEAIVNEMKYNTITLDWQTTGWFEISFKPREDAPITRRYMGKEPFCQKSYGSLWLLILEVERLFQSKEIDLGCKWFDKYERRVSKYENDHYIERFTHRNLFIYGFKHRKIVRKFCQGDRKQVDQNVLDAISNIKNLNNKLERH